MDEGDSIIFEQTIGLALSPENGHVDLLVMLGHADLNDFFHSVLRQLDSGSCFETYIMKVK